MFPQVSIIMAAFNAEAYIGHAIASALSQTYSDLEVVVVDDGSTDATLDEVVQIASADRRVRLLRHEKNRGAAAACNTALAAAQGEWITHLDSDDAYAPNRLEYLLTGARETAADMVADNLMLCSFPARLPLEPAVHPDSSLFIRPLALSDFVTDKSIDGNISLGFVKPLIRREFMRVKSIHYREDLKVVYDFRLWIECLIHGARFFLLREPLYWYSLRPGSLSNCKSKTAIAELDKCNRELMGWAPIVARPDWVQLFLNRQQTINRALLYARFAEAIRQRRLLEACNIVRCHPEEVGHFTSRLSEAARRRLVGTPYRPHGGTA